MLIFRPVNQRDISSLLNLTEEVNGSVSSLPQDVDYLETKIALSLAAFQSGASSQTNGSYFFVLEDSQTQQVVGTAGITAKIEYEIPYYTFKIINRVRISAQLGIRHAYQRLNLVEDCQNMTEIGSLYLKKQYRSARLGQFLSRARFLFMAQFPQRFSEVVFASMQGVLNEQGESPFWQCLGKHFFLMSFKKADRLATTGNRQFIADLMPNFPIYVNLLPDIAQKVIGQVNRVTQKALEILTYEGFEFNDMIDIFDGGPCVQGNLGDIKSVRSSKVVKINHITPMALESDYLISNCNLSFRACLGKLQEQGKNCHISPEVARALAVKPGDEIRYVSYEKQPQ